jgi:hypothetical protein
MTIWSELRVVENGRREIMGPEKPDLKSTIQTDKKKYTTK